MIVSWMSEFNGGFNQDFFIQYRADDKEIWTTTGPVEDASGKKMHYSLYELESTKQYFVRMFSRNKIGDSNITNITVSRTFSKYTFGNMLLVC